MEALATLKLALNSNKSIVFGAECEILYSGRAESFLPAGERIVLIKQDGTILIHQPTGSVPINYMKEATHKIVEKEDVSILKSNSGDELLEILLLKIHFVHSKQFEDGAKLQLQGSEKDMADMIMKEPKLIDPDFTPVSQEEQTKYGFIDVLGKDKKGNLVVVECKRYNGDLSAVTQLRRYVEKMKETLGVKSIRGILACPKITGNAKKMLEDWGFEYRQVSPPNFMEKKDKSQLRLGEF